MPRPDRPSSPQPAETPPPPAAVAHPSAHDTGPAPGPVPRAVLVLTGAGGLVLLIAGMRSVADLLAPTFLAITLVITVAPLQRRLLRLGIPRWLAVTVSLLLLYGLLIALVTALVLSLVQLVELLPGYAAQFQTLYEDALAQLAAWGVEDAQLRVALDAVDPSSLLGVAQNVLLQALSGLTGALSLLTLLVTVLLFLVVDSVDVPRRMLLARASHPRLVTALAEFADGVRRYWLVSTVFGLIVAALGSAGLYWLGVPLALTWGLLAFITNYIPNIGFVLGLVPPVLVALLEGGVGLALAVFALYSVLNLVIQTVIQPRFTGEAVGLTTTAAFLSLLFWSYVLGPLGALLAVPMSSFVKAVLVDSDPRARWLDALLASRPGTPPGVRGAVPATAGEGAAPTAQDARSTA